MGHLNPKRGNGVVFFAIGMDNDTIAKYLDIVHATVESYRAQNPSLSIALATSELGLCKDSHFDAYIYVPPEAGKGNSIWTSRLRYSLFTPYLTSLFPDTDTRCCGSLDDLFGDLRMDLASGSHHPKIFTPDNGIRLIRWNDRSAVFVCSLSLQLSKTCFR